MSGMFMDVIDNKTGSVPPSFGRWVSPQARAFFTDMLAGPPAPVGDVAAQRAHYDRINSARLARALQRYPVAITMGEVDGVVVHEVIPAEVTGGTLICLHGGAFQWGAGAGALLEAVPVAATTGKRVVAVQYRLAPEHRFPCAVEDVLAVLRVVRRDAPRRIGIYGCSAGAALTAQVVARLVADGTDVPDAVAMLHGSGLEVGGDSLALAAQLNGTPAAGDIQRMHDLSYFAGSDPADPLVFPGEHPAVLAAFPPSLLISGTRDFAASGVATMQRRLAATGVDARLVLFDGMWHAHHVDVDLPEAQETYAVMADFFRRHLG